MRYDDLPLVQVSFKLDSDNLPDNFNNYSDKDIAEKQSLFFNGEFNLDATVHALSSFMVSANAMENLIYPQLFVIAEDYKGCYTDRSDIASYELRLTLEGEGFLEYGDRTYRLKRGEGYFIDLRKHHRYGTAGERWKTTNLHFNGNPVDNIFQHYLERGTVKFSLNRCPNFEMIQHETLKASQKVSPYMEYRVSTLFHLLLTELLTCDEKPSATSLQADLMGEVAAYIRQHCAEPITIEHLSRRFAISGAHLSREFKRNTGFTPRQYLVQARINKAKMLLWSSGQNVEEICQAVGFRDTSYFIEIFKKHEGVTPLKYRSSNRF